MESYLNKYLLKQNLIKLNNLKIVEGSNKKIISSCIFIPETPKVHDKVFSYFTGVIKSIETFTENLSKKWIYRLYVDDLFFNGLQKKDGKMHYDYNNLSSSNSNNSPQRIWGMPRTHRHKTKDPVKLYRKTVKKGIKKNKDNLKKLQTLLNNYLQNIIDSEDERYSNIEIISFRCNVVKFTGKYPGHANTFGSIIRFFPIFDSDVDIFVSVNSRYPINPLMSTIINDWTSRKKKKILSFSYNASHFIKKCLEDSIYKYLKELKQGWETSYSNLFKDVVDDIFEIKQELCPSKEPLNIDEIKNEKLQYLLSGPFDSHDEINDISIAAGFFGMKRHPHPFFEKKVEMFAKLLRFLILKKDKFTFGIDEVLLKLTLSLESGTLDMKHEIPNQSIVFIDSDSVQSDKLTNSQILKKLSDTDKEYFKNIEGRIQDVKLSDLKKLNPKVNDFDLKNAMEEVFNTGRTIIDYYYFLEDSGRDHKIYKTTPLKIYEPYFEGLKNISNKPLTLPQELHHNYLDLIGGDLLEVGAFQSRSLFITREDKPKKLGKNEILKVYYNSGEDLQTILIDLIILTSDYSEYRKLFLYDPKEGEYSNLKRLFYFFDEQYFVPIDINDYSLENINCLVNLIVNHYRKDNLKYRLYELEDQTGSGIRSLIKRKKRYIKSNFKTKKSSKFF
jgi:hypothetical protein